MSNLNFHFSWHYNSTGMEISFINWAEDEPNNAGDNSQNCVAIGIEVSDRWDDYYCDEPTKYLCEKEAE